MGDEREVFCEIITLNIFLKFTYVLQIHEIFKNTNCHAQTMSHIPRTETQVKKIVSDIPPHANQNIGIG